MNYLTTELRDIKESGHYRQLTWLEGPQAARTIIGGRSCILMASNNYLGLTEHPDVKKAAVQAIARWGTGAGGSRLVTGNYGLYRELEEKIIQFKNTKEAIVFNSGYMANLGTISSLAGQGDAVISDELNHASIIDGCRLSGARVAIYKHKNMDRLEEVLKETRNCRRRLIITDGVFSMDGDLAPLPEIVELAKEYDALVMVDDAHATGVFGSRGAGTVEHFNLEGRVAVQMGTLSKALASSGAYVTGEKELIDYLRNKARTFIFSTGLPPAAVGAAIAAIDVVMKEPEMRMKLRENAGFLYNGLTRMGFRIPISESQIIPVFTGDESRTMLMARMLLKYGIYITGIRPPSVPPGTCRLRVTVMATHTREDLEQALDAFERAGKETEII